MGQQRRQAARPLDHHDEAVRLRRRQLSAFPTASSYAALRRAAERSGQWPGERLDALDILLERNIRDYVVTLLREGQVDLAWGVSRTMALAVNLRAQLLEPARRHTRPRCSMSMCPSSRTR